MYSRVHGDSGITKDCGAGVAPTPVCSTYDLIMTTPVTDSGVCSVVCLLLFFFIVIWF